MKNRLLLLFFASLCNMNQSWAFTCEEIFTESIIQLKYTEINHILKTEPRWMDFVQKDPEAIQAYVVMILQALYEVSPSETSPQESRIFYSLQNQWSFLKAMKDFRDENRVSDGLYGFFLKELETTPFHVPKDVNPFGMAQIRGQVEFLRLQLGEVPIQ